MGDLFLAPPFAARNSDERLRFGIQGEAQRFFVFLILSLLLEKKADASAADHVLAEALERLFADELLDARRTTQKIVGAAPSYDPFSAYYDSFAKGALDPRLSPFGVFAQTLSAKYFLGAQQETAYDRLFAQSAAYADKIAESLSNR